MFGRKKYEDDYYEEDENGLGGSFTPPMKLDVRDGVIALLLGLAGFISGTDAATGQTVVTITNEASVQTMIWSLFSLFPAAIALLILLLLRLYPIDK